MTPLCSIVFTAMTTLPATDVFYRALLGEPDVVEASALMAAPGRYVGRAVRTRGRLERSGAKGEGFSIASGPAHALLRLEPEAATLAGARASSWVGRAVEVEGFFYRQPEDTSTDAHALRTWRMAPVGGLDERPAGHEPVVTLEALVYGGGRYDGTAVRVRGIHRGSNLHHDLPEATRRGRGDWVLKDGYFAAWVSGHEPRAGDGRAASGAVLDVVGVPSTVNGVVRLAAQEVEISLDMLADAVSSAPPAGNPGWAAVPPRVSFAYPVPGQTLGAAGLMLVQFSKPMDPARLPAGVRVRFERDGTATGTPEVKLQYRDRYRAVVITPKPPPPPGTDVVVELLDVLVDVGGRRLARRAGTDHVEPVVERIRFRGRP